MQFTIPLIPPTYNQHIHINYAIKQVYLTKKAREFKRSVKLLTPPNSKLSDNSKLQLKVEIHNDWYYKNGKVKRLDIQNLDKLLIDAICEKWGIDDCRIWDSHFLKVQSAEKKTVVDIWEM